VYDDGYFEDHSFYELQVQACQLVAPAAAALVTHCSEAAVTVGHELLENQYP
jgi:hypothetical protein